MEAKVRLRALHLNEISLLWVLYVHRNKCAPLLCGQGCPILSPQFPVPEQILIYLTEIWEQPSCHISIDPSKGVEDMDVLGSLARIVANRRTRHAPWCWLATGKCWMWPARGNKPVWAKGWGYVLAVPWSNGVLAQQLLLSQAPSWKLGRCCEIMHISPLRVFLFLMQKKKRKRSF